MDSNHHLQNRNLACYQLHHGVVYFTCRPRRNRTFANRTKTCCATIIPYGKLSSGGRTRTYEVIRKRIFSQAQGTPVHPRCHWSTPDFLSGASWIRTTFSGFSVPRIHQVCQNSLLMLPQMESNHHLQIQNLPHYRYAIGQVCGG